MTFQDLYETHFDFVWRTLRRMGVPEADVSDVLQEVFLTVHRKLPEFEGRSKITTWLFQISMGAARDRRRKAHHRREVLDEGVLERVAPQGAAPDALLELHQEIELLDRALEALSLDQRAVFLLFELEELGGEEIAEMLQLPLGTVYSRLRLGRTAFQRAVRQLTGRGAPALSFAAENSS